MGMLDRIKRLELQAEDRDSGNQITAIVVCYPGDREPTEAETEAAIEAYRLKHGDGPVALLSWDGEKFIGEG